MQKTLSEMNEEEKFFRGMNDGYLLNKYEPGIATKVLKDLQSNNEYIDGLQTGSQEYEKEKQLHELNELENLRNQSKERDEEVDRNLND